VKLDRHHPLLLASASPRRRELLTRIGVPLVFAAVDVDELVRAGESPEHYLERVVTAKLTAAAALQREAAAGAGRDESSARVAAARLMLVADTTVVHAGRILGKPRSTAEAAAMVAALSGSEHRVLTRFAMAEAGEAQPLVVETVTTRVWFRQLDEAQIERYAACGEGRDKAGGYALQGVGVALVERLAGCHANVIGLPVAAVVGHLQRLGYLGPCPPEAD